MSFINTYLTATAHDNTSPLYKQWCAIYAVAAAVQRKCWIMSLNEIIYGNLFMLLVGPSAAGKGVALGPLAVMLAKLPHQFIAPASCTTAGLADELEEAETSFISRTGRGFQYNALTVIAREFGVFLPAYDSAMMNTLQDLYDNKGYDERRRGKGKRLTVPNAMLNLIGGCTPAYLNNTLPEGAWEEGLMSRTICIYSGPMAAVEIVEELNTVVDLAAAEAELFDIAERDGRLHWEPTALRFLNDWNLSGRKPEPSHPKLGTYNSRRLINTMKLSMLHCIARSGMKITVADVQASLDLLVETEARIPEIFKAMRSGGDQAAIRDLIHFMMTLQAKSQKPVPKHTLIQFLHDKVPAHSIDRIIQVMEFGRFIQSVAGGAYIVTARSTD